MGHKRFDLKVVLAAGRGLMLKETQKKKIPFLCFVFSRRTSLPSLPLQSRMVLCICVSSKIIDHPFKQKKKKEKEK